MAVILVGDRSGLGQKRECPHCGVHYYDFGKTMELCPCGKVSVVQSASRARRPIISDDSEEDTPPLMDEIELEATTEEETEDTDDADFEDVDASEELGDDDTTYIEDEEGKDAVDGIIVGTQLDDDPDE